MVIEYEKMGKIAIFTLNRPNVLNAQNLEMIRELHRVMLLFRDDPDAWVGIITGAGNLAFSVGADIKEFSPESFKEVLSINPIRADQIWKPFVAAINGYCFGSGMELALTCDLRIAADNSLFSLPETKVGVIPAGGGISRLPRFVSRTKATEILLMGQTTNAEEAYRIGLVNKVVTLDQLMPTAIQWATIICEAGPLQTRAVKETMIKGYNMTLDDSLRLEKEMAERNTFTDDFKEGVKAFVEKRKPCWEDK
jgi:E-phenylitaconyl-CoA hydratase